MVAPHLLAALWLCVVAWCPGCTASTQYLCTSRIKDQPYFYGNGTLLSGVSVLPYRANSSCFATVKVPINAQMSLACTVTGSTPGTALKVKSGPLDLVLNSLNEALVFFANSPPVSSSASLVFNNVTGSLSFLETIGEQIPTMRILSCSYNVSLLYPVASCGPGTFFVSGTCVPCSRTTFQTAADHTFTACKDCSYCNLGFQDVVKCTSTSDRTCEIAPETRFLCEQEPAVLLNISAPEFVLLSGNRTVLYSPVERCWTTLIVPENYSIALDCDFEMGPADYVKLGFRMNPTYSSFAAASEGLFDIDPWTGYSFHGFNGIEQGVVVLVSVSDTVAAPARTLLPPVFQCTVTLLPTVYCNQGEFVDSENVCTLCPIGFFQPEVHRRSTECFLCRDFCPMFYIEKTPCTGSTDRVCAPPDNSFFLCDNDTAAILVIPNVAKGYIFSGTRDDPWEAQQRCWRSFSFPTRRQIALSCAYRRPAGGDFSLLSLSSPKVFSNYSEAATATFFEVPLTQVGSQPAGVTFYAGGLLMVWTANVVNLVNYGVQCNFTLAEACGAGDIYYGLESDGSAICAPCPTGTYQPSPSSIQSSCIYCTVCRDGFEEETPCTAGQNRVCRLLNTTIFLCDQVGKSVYLSGSGKIFGGNEAGTHFWYGSCGTTVLLPPNTQASLRCKFYANTKVDFLQVLGNNTHVHPNVSELAQALVSAPRYGLTGTYTVVSGLMFGFQLLWATPFGAGAIMNPSMTCNVTVINLTEPCEAGQRLDGILCMACSQETFQTEAFHRNCDCSLCRPRCPDASVETVPCTATTDRVCMFSGANVSTFFLCDMLPFQELMDVSGWLFSGNSTQSYTNTQNCTAIFQIPAKKQLKLTCSYSTEIVYDSLTVLLEGNRPVAVATPFGFVFSELSPFSGLGFMEVANLTGLFGLRWETDFSVVSGFGVECQYLMLAACGVGTFLNETSRQCSLCQLGSYQDIPGHLETRCKDCSLSCPSGYEFQADCSSSSDRVCVLSNTTYFVCSVPSHSMMLPAGSFGHVFSGNSSAMYSNNQQCWVTFVLPPNQMMVLQCTYEIGDQGDYMLVSPDTRVTAENFSSALKLADLNLPLNGVAGSVMRSGLVNGVVIVWNTDSFLTDGSGFSCSYNVSNPMYCHAGTFLRGFTCQPCPIGSYQDNTHHTFLSCFPCRPSCGAAQNETGVCTSSTNRVCAYLGPESGTYFLCDQSSHVVNVTHERGFILGGSVSNVYGPSQACWATFLLPVRKVLRLFCDFDTTSKEDSVVFEFYSPHPYANLSSIQQAAALSDPYSVILAILFPLIFDDFSMLWTTGPSQPKYGSGVVCSFQLLTACFAGQYVAALPGSVPATVCKSCSVGSYRSEWRHKITFCDNCTAFCGFGWFESAPCTHTSDRTCSINPETHLLCNTTVKPVLLKSNGWIRNDNPSLKSLPNAVCFKKFALPEGQQTVLHCEYDLGIHNDSALEIIVGDNPISTDSPYIADSSERDLFFRFSSKGNFTQYGFTFWSMRWDIQFSSSTSSDYLACNITITPIRPCRAGEYRIRDTYCKTCTTGKFQAAVNANNDNCEPCRECKVGSYETAPCTATSDRICKASPNRYFSCDNDKTTFSSTLEAPSGVVYGGGKYRYFEVLGPCWHTFLVPDNKQLYFVCTAEYRSTSTYFLSGDTSSSAAKNNDALIVLNQYPNKRGFLMFSGYQKGFMLFSIMYEESLQSEFTCTYNITARVLCPAGFYLNRASCVQCATGTFYSNASHHSDGCLDCRVPCESFLAEIVPCTTTTDRVCGRKQGDVFLCGVSKRSMVLSNSGTIYTGLQYDSRAQNGYCWGTLIIPVGMQVVSTCDFVVNGSQNFLKAGFGPVITFNTFEEATVGLAQYDKKVGRGQLFFNGGTTALLFLWSVVGEGALNSTLQCPYSLSKIILCEPGEYLNGTDCETCPPDTYQSALSHRFRICFPCISGFLTDERRPAFCGLFVLLLSG
jgi:hypothetical protein